MVVLVQDFSDYYFLIMVKGLVTSYVLVLWSAPTQLVEDFSLGVLLNVVYVWAVLKLRRFLEQLFNKNLFLKFWFSYWRKKKKQNKTIITFLP